MRWTLRPLAMFSSILSFALRVVVIGFLCVSVAQAADSAQPSLFDALGKFFQPRKEAPVEAAVMPAESATMARNPARMVAVPSEERRVALVVGNNGYLHVSRLENAVGDAHAMAREFRALGFDVIEKTDVDQRAMKAAVRDFVQRIGNGGVGAFFFAGHGVQEGGNNYLLPVDIGALTDPAALADEAVELNGEVMARIGQAGAKFSLLVIDACRDNPFPRKAGRSIGGTRGLTVPATPEGMVVVYSAGVNQQALDRLGDSDRAPNSLFTREFIREMRKPGLEVAEVVRNVRQRVKEQAALVRHEQTPAIYIQADRYYLIPNAQNVTIHTQPSAEDSLWAQIDPYRPCDYQAYVDQYPQGTFVSLAKLRLKECSHGRETKAVAVVPGVAEKTVSTPTVPLNSGIANIDPEGAFWNEVRTSAVKEYFDAYLKQYPRGRYVALAKVELKRIEDREKAERAREDAERKLAAEQERQGILRSEHQAWERARADNTSVAYAAYLERYPKGSFAALAEAAKQLVQRDEDDLWRRTETAIDALAFQTYIDRYPTGRYAAEARRKLKALAHSVGSVSTPASGGPSPGGNARPIAVAVPQFGGNPAIAGELHAIVVADLERGGLAKVVASNGVSIAEPAATNFGEWEARGAEALVLGSIHADTDGRHETRIRVLDVRKQLQLGGVAYGHTAKQIRPTGHRISDFIAERLTGEGGIASTRIAYVRQSPGGYELVIADSDGGNPQIALRSRQAIVSPMWSPDGQSIAYVSFEHSKVEMNYPHPVVLRHSLKDGKRSVCLNPPVGARSLSFTWAPNGDSLAIAANQDDRSVIYIASANGTEQKIVASSSHQDTHPSFSRDGREIYFASNRAGVRKIYRISAAGGSPQLVSGHNGESYAPTVSADGQTLAFLVADGGLSRLALMDFATGRIAVLAESVVDEGLSFSSTGRHLMFTGWSGNSKELKVLTVGKQVTRPWATTIDLVSSKDFALGPNPH